MNIQENVVAQGTELEKFLSYLSKQKGMVNVNNKCAIV
jgi:hypothetical protein